MYDHKDNRRYNFHKFKKEKPFICLTRNRLPKNGGYLISFQIKKYRRLSWAGILKNISGPYLIIRGCSYNVITHRRRQRWKLATRVSYIDKHQKKWHIPQNIIHLPNLT